MKIEILKENLRDAKTGKDLKKSQTIEVDEKRGQKAVNQGIAKAVDTPKKENDAKKSTQEKVSKKTTKK